MTLQNKLTELIKNAKSAEKFSDGVRYTDEFYATISREFLSGNVVALDGLADMVPELEWEGGCVSMTAYTPFGHYLVEKDGEFGFGFWPPGYDIEADPKGGFHKGADAAKAAASTHYRATILKALGVKQ